MKSRWTGGNRARLLENGEAFFPAVFEAIRHAEHEVLIETFILFEDKVGNALRDVLLDAARRGDQIDLRWAGSLPRHAPRLESASRGAMASATPGAPWRLKH